MRLTEAEYTALLARGTVREVGTQQGVSRARELRRSVVQRPPPAIMAPMAERFAVTLILPWAPSVNRSLVYGQRGRMIARKAIWAYRAAVCCAVEAQWPVTLVRPLNGRLALRIVFSPATRRVFDLDNPIKQIFDSLGTDGYPSPHPRASVYLDDRQIDYFEVTRGPVCASPAVVTVHIAPFP